MTGDARIRDPALLEQEGRLALRVLAAAPRPEPHQRIWPQRSGPWHVFPGPLLRRRGKRSGGGLGGRSAASDDPALLHDRPLAAG